ncbi:uncharacterized protein KQ657_000706 [Scheffersomyces spartinae]|uniref:SB domain-containing protein n=1 Tax=Scheffersomyces spartinae TaxID=45513 RepID=A0A9P7V923_9ASCO|nr:uncharacterized protein KQ657_000706 [Scheffersomyces spartinae]KAG7193295.1 hypothetical protein KQ657_000706 [Scheffersomyces spartinae]
MLTVRESFTIHFLLRGFKSVYKVMPHPLQDTTFLNLQSISHVSSGSPFKKSFKFAPNALQQPQPEYPLAAENIQSPPDAIYSEPQDLMDNIELSYLTANHTLNHMAQLSTDYETAMGNIEDNINKYLQGELKDTMVRKIDQNCMKVNALYDQLTFYHKQAQANSNKLAEHKDYLGSQVEKISQLNAKLVELEKKQEPRKIYVSETSAFDLDKIAMPDLALVSQLYNTVADIRATKDVINAISGTFSSEPEFISDSNLDSCVKAVRGLGRELFWQELTKNHIATIMGLITE